MSDDHEFDLNSPHRFEKRSERLVLQQPAPIPAGCGGLVFSWLDPNDGIPIQVHVATLGEATVYVNGNIVAQSRARVDLGMVVIAVQLVRDLEAAGNINWFRFAASHTTSTWGGETGRQLIPALGTDSTGWMITTVEPPADWTNLHSDLGDSWLPLAPSSVGASALESLERRDHWRVNGWLTDSMTPMGLPDTEHVWLRLETELQR